MSDDAKLYEKTLDRFTAALKCECGGYAEEAGITRTEDKKYGCGRFGCCAAAFVCGLCGQRWVARLEAPEMV